MIAAALLVLPVVVVEFSASELPWVNLTTGVDWLIWLDPLVDLAVMLTLVGDRKAYLKSAGPDAFIAVSSFPVLAAVGSSRMLRLWRHGPALRLLKMFRLAVILSRGGRAVERLSNRGGLGSVVAGTVIITLSFGAHFDHRPAIERAVGTPWDGVWWALVRRPWWDMATYPRSRSWAEFLQRS